MPLDNKPLPRGEGPDDYVLRAFLDSVKNSLLTRTFTPIVSGVTNVTTSRARYQRLGQIVYVTMVFEGTNVGLTTGSTIDLPIKPYTASKESPKLVFPSNSFVFGNIEGALITHGHQVTDTIRISPDDAVTAGSGLTVQGFYWADEIK